MTEAEKIGIAKTILLLALPVIAGMVAWWLSGGFGGLLAMGLGFLLFPVLLLVLVLGLVNPWPF